MSKIAAETFGITQSELLDFLNIASSTSVHIKEKITSGFLVKPTPSNLQAIAISILVVAIAVFIGSLFLFYHFGKKRKQFDRKRFLADVQEERSKSKHDTTKSLLDTSKEPKLQGKLVFLEEEDEKLEKLRVKKINMTASYFPGRERMRIILDSICVQSVDISLTDYMFLYFKMELEPEQIIKFESDLRHMSSRVSFDYTAELDLKLADINQHKIKVSVFVCDRYSKNRMLGENLYSMEADASRTDSTTNELLDGKSLISISLTNISTIIPSVSQKATDVSAPEILFSLCYMPSSEMLTVTVLKARHLDAGPESQIMTYVQISLSIKGNLCKTVQTSAVRCSSTPAYNEAFSFPLGLDKLAESEIFFSIINFDTDNKNTILGKLSVGGKTEKKSSLAHWESMLDSPRRPVAQWHALELMNSS